MIMSRLEAGGPQDRIRDDPGSVLHMPGRPAFDRLRPSL
jgi:hypothetical protein